MLRQQEAAATSSAWQILQLAPTATQGKHALMMYRKFSRMGVSELLRAPTHGRHSLLKQTHTYLKHRARAA